MNDKVTKESFTAYRNWQRYILATRPAIPPRYEGCTRPTLLLYCFVMASHGTNGLGCFASDKTIAEEIGMYDFRSVMWYRRLAVDLGWFVWNGERRGRTKVLDIAIPKDEETTRRRVVSAEPKPAEDVPKVTDAGHDRSTAPGYCAACRPFFARVASGEMTVDQLFKIHAGD